MKDNMRIEKEIKYIQHTDRSEIREREWSMAWVVCWLCAEGLRLGSFALSKQAATQPSQAQSQR